MTSIGGFLPGAAAFISGAWPAVRTKTPLDDRLIALADPVAHQLGLEIVRVRVMGGKRMRAQIMAERPDGSMSVEDCAALSRGLSDLLETEDPIAGEYDLEVSSPGIDRPLTALAHFERWTGFTAKLELDRLVEGRKRFTGALAGVEDGNVLLDIKGEDETALIPFSWIADAKLVLTDALMKADLQARTTAPDEQGSSSTP